jgi:hypothetical protein
MNAQKHLITLSSLGTALLLTSPGQALAADVTGTLIQTFNLNNQQVPAFSPPSPDPSGIAYDPFGGSLIIVDGEVEEIGPGHPGSFVGSNVFQATLSGNGLLNIPPGHTDHGVAYTGSPAMDPPGSTAASVEPVGAAFNPDNGHFYYSDDDKNEVYDVDPVDGILFNVTDAVTSFDTGSDNGDPEGAAYGNGTIYIADGFSEEIFKYDALTRTRLGNCDISGLNGGNITAPDALEFNPDTGNLLVMGSAPDTLVFEITTDCALVRTIDVSTANASRIGGLAVAPGSQGATDPTPGVLNLWLADRRVDNNSNINENDGKVYEFSLPGSTPGNQAPVVNAEPEAQTISFPANATLTGTLSDDGVPQAATTTWTKSSGPGNVTFGDPNALNTTASFSTPGIYNLRLTANDTELQGFDDVTVTVQGPPSSFSTVYISAKDNGTAGGLAFADEDIIAYNTSTQTWSMYFDGSDVGLGIGFDLDAFDIEENNQNTILLSFNSDGVNVPGVGLVDDADIVRFTPTSIGDTTAGTFTMYFDGSDVGLDPTNTSEDVDAIAFLPDGRLVISTTGSFAVPGVSGADEDLIAFNPTSLGSVTSGAWALHFDGSDVALTSSSEDIFGAWINPANNDIHLTTTGDFAVTGVNASAVSGGGDDIFRCTPTSTGATTACIFDPVLTFDGIGSGLPAGAVLDGMELVPTP